MTLRARLVRLEKTARQWGKANNQTTLRLDRLTDADLQEAEELLQRAECKASLDNLECKGGDELGATNRLTSEEWARLEELDAICRGVAYVIPDNGRDPQLVRLLKEGQQR